MRLTTTLLFGLISYLTLCHDASDGASHLSSGELDEQDVNRLMSLTDDLVSIRSRRSAHDVDEDKRSPLPRLGVRSPLPRLGQRSDEELEESAAAEDSSMREKRLPRFGREEMLEEKEKRLPRLGIRSPLPRLGLRLTEEKRLPRLGLRSPLPRLGLRQSGEEDEDEEEEEVGGLEEDLEGDESMYEGETRSKRLPRFGLKRASPFPRLGRSYEGKRAAPFPRLGRASPFPRLGRQSDEYNDYIEVEERAAPFPRLGRAAPFPRLGRAAPFPRLG